MDTSFKEKKETRKSYHRLGDGMEFVTRRNGIRDQTGLALWENGDREASIHAFRGRPAFPEEVTENPTSQAVRMQVSEK
jgi:hypothetical protein